MKKKSKHRGLKIIISVILILLILACAAYIATYYWGTVSSNKAYKDMLIGAQTSLEEYPYDFNYLTSQNDEIYAWIKIDDTNVDYPISQSKTDDEFYLKHNSADKEYSSSGAIYTESCNATDFSDPVTVIYGHNGYGTSMFTTLHKFEDEDFFNSHEYYNIWLDGRKLTYQIISAFRYDNRHLLNAFNVSDPDDLYLFQQLVLNPDSEVKNVRTDLDVDIDDDSNIVVLSTCVSYIANREQYRYLVASVLVKDEATL